MASLAGYFSEFRRCLRGSWSLYFSTDSSGFAARTVDVRSRRALYRVAFWTLESVLFAMHKCLTSPTRPNQGAAANRRPAGQSDGSDNLSVTFAASRAFPAAVAELDC